MAEMAEMAEVTEGTEGPAETPLLEVREVSFGYGSELILDRVHLPIYPRDYLVVLGPNGGGKTTLLKLILGLLTPWSGTIVDRLSPRRDKFGYVPQFSTFDRGFPLRVAEAVLMGRLGRGGLLARYRREDREAVDETLALLALEDLAGSHIGELSGGQLQRVLIARALVSRPEILFLDEPTASIDAESREVLRRVLSRENERIPIVVVTHDVTSVAPAARHVACVNRTLHYHGTSELTAEILEEAYGCPVELIAHGVPHRVLREHG